MLLQSDASGITELRKWYNRVTQVVCAPVEAVEAVRSDDTTLLSTLVADSKAEAVLQHAFSKRTLNEI